MAVSCLLSSTVFRLFSAFFVVGGFTLTGAHVRAEASPALENRNRNNTDWLYHGKIGLSTHYLAVGPEHLNRIADDFRVSDVAEQTVRAGASWFLFTVQHEGWVMTAPNATYNRILGDSSYTSKRDVPLELSEALRRKGVRLMLYVNLRIDQDSACPPRVREALGGWPPNDDVINNIAAIYRELSVRYGKEVSGWWVDGATSNLFKDDVKRERWLRIIGNALRAGNAEAIVAFNPGFKMIRYSAQNDYIAGESKDLEPLPSNGRWLDGVQSHRWTFLGGWWGSGGTRFSNERLLNYTKQLIANGGAITFEVGTMGIVKRDRYDRGVHSPNYGRIDPEQVEQVRFVTEGVREKVKAKRLDLIVK